MLDALYLFTFAIQKTSRKKKVYMHYLHLEKTLVFFDLETTGVNPQTDRIVEVCFLLAKPDGTTEIHTHLINPTIPISPEATLVHGISDKDVRNMPTFKEMSKQFEALLKDCDLAGYNMLKFDLPMLIEEFQRAGIVFDISDRRLVDAQKIFFMMEPRNLSAAYRFYCGGDITDLGKGAHSAETDTLATYHVLNEQVRRYENVAIKDADNQPYVPIKNNIDALHTVSTEKMVDLAGRIVLNAANEPVFNFGKHKNKTVVQALKEEPTFYDWIMRSDFPLDTKNHLHRIKLKMLQEKLKG